MWKVYILQYGAGPDQILLILIISHETSTQRFLNLFFPHAPLGIFNVSNVPPSLCMKWKTKQTQKNITFGIFASTVLKGRKYITLLT